MNNMTPLGENFFPILPKQAHLSEVGEFENNPNIRFRETILNLTQIQGYIKDTVVLNPQNKVDRSSLSRLNTSKIGNIDVDGLNKLVVEYSQINKDKFSGDGVIDKIAILGALVIIYDSSKGIPNYFDKNNRGECKTIYFNGEYISVIGIDVNAASRKEDNVSPQTSLHHELQHHLNVTIGDQLIAGEDFKEAIRKDDPPNGFRSKSDWISGREDLISKLFGRKIILKSPHPSVKSIDYIAYEEQMHYLDELSASFGQQKGSIFGPKQLFYNNINPNTRTHYEIVGNNKEDTENLKKLFTEFIMPGIYMFSLIKNYEGEISKLENERSNDLLKNATNQATIKNHKDYIINIKYCIHLITQTLGVSRTINQAVTLLYDFWRSDISLKLSENDLKWLKDNSKLLHTHL